VIPGDRDRFMGLTRMSGHDTGTVGHDAGTA